MRLLDDVCLVESNVLALPTASMFERSMIIMNTAILGLNCNSSWEYDRKPSLEENRGKIANSFGAHFGQGRGQESEPVSVVHRVEYSQSHAASDPKIGW